MTPLLPLRSSPLTHPQTWSAVEALGAGVTVLLDIEPGPASCLDRAWTTATTRLAKSGAKLIGRVDLGFSTRAVEQVRAELARWAGYPVGGIFFDHAPTSPFSIGPVAMAVRAARRVGFDTLLINPGRPTDPVYRALGAVLCTFEGSWEQYQLGCGDGVPPGDAHLVYSVPADQVERCHALMRQRGARFGLAEPLALADIRTAALDPASGAR